jgi:predicted DNA binding CopG/RHH family protein
VQGIDFSSSRGGGQENRRLDSFSFHSVNFGGQRAFATSPRELLPRGRLLNDARERGRNGAPAFAEATAGQAGAPTILHSVEHGEWKSAKGGKRERARYSRYSKATFRKDRRLNIRLSSKDLEAIQKRALAEGLPYQTLIASLLHKYATGRLKEG